MKAIKYPHTFAPTGQRDGAWVYMHCIHCGKTYLSGHEECPIEACPAFKMFVMVPYEKKDK